MVARAVDHPAFTGVIPTPYNPDPVLLAIVQTIRDGLLRDQHVRLHNFGTFRLRWSKERRIKHPKTGEYVVAPPAPKITFTPAKHLREWVEPNPKPVIPLDEPVNLQQSNGQHSDQKESGSTDQRNKAEYNLQETVQDIIDEEYNPTSTPSNFITSKKDTDASVNTENGNNKKWTIGLITAVPLILMMLQAEFSTDDQTNSAIEPTIELQTNQKQTSASVVADSRIIRTETTASTPTQETTQETSRETISATSIATARPEPTPKPFYMTPQLHTIEQGDNLWKLAKEFYGDALLWPHIYRANTRTLNDPDIIATGKQLVIPGLQQSPESLSINDKELITEGYFKVYQLSKAKNSPQAIYFLIGAKQYSFDWLKRNRQDISREDWKVINNR